MTISSVERKASILEMAVEIDRRGAVIESLESEVERLRGLFKIQTDSYAEQQETVREFAAQLIADSNLSRFMESRICCNGVDCGCMGATVQSYIEWVSGISHHTGCGSGWEKS